ncbi:MAG TPA: SpoIID/LytB domain-containing protein [Candidatus Binatia bacterium]|nr:SpoIID/LytB domain-containing protein [Candidatus Binatia bacterium]
MALRAGVRALAAAAVAGGILVLAWLGPSAPRAAPGSGTIRVALVESAPAVELRGADIEVVPLGFCARCPGAARRTDAVRAVVASGGVAIDGQVATGFRLGASGPLRFAGRDYPSPLEIVRNGAGLAVINELPLEDYLVGVLIAEAGDRWPAEALRAQAIAARTYAAHHRRIAAGKLYHLVASTAHQQYAGLAPAGSPARSAVLETAGQVLRWEGAVFPAFYHTESGGYTEDPRTVFAAPNMPALRPVVCPFSVGSPHYYWTLDLPVADLTERLRRGGVDVGRITGVEVAERTLSLRATAVTVRGTRGAARLRGNDFRRLVGYDVLKSTLFAVAVDGERASFAGRGYGHGVGLCQWGAKAMAEQGYTAAQILEFYYPGTVLGALEDDR